MVYQTSPSICTKRTLLGRAGFPKGETGAETMELGKSETSLESWSVWIHRALERSSHAMTFDQMVDSLRKYIPRKQRANKMQAESLEYWYVTSNTSKLKTWKYTHGVEHELRNRDFCRCIQWDDGVEPAGISRGMNQRGAGSVSLNAPEISRNTSNPGGLACLSCWNKHFGSG